MDERIGVIGLGRMGHALAARLAMQGYAVTGWTRSGIDPAAARAAGFASVSSLADAVSAADVLLLSLFDEAAVTDVLSRLAALDLSGRLLVETSTVSPEVVRSAAPAIEAAGGRIIDAPISGGPEMVAAGTIGLFVGGAESDVARFAPIAVHLTPRAVPVGALGAGHAAKIVNNVALGGAWQAMIESMRLGARLGLDLPTMVELLRESPASNPSFRTRVPKILGEDDEVGFPVAGVVKDQTLFLRIAEAAGENLPALTAARGNFAAAAEAGLADADLARVIPFRVRRT
ncbi:NAD(P)-dependent oxidoreductase [Palleronia sp. KMU-117]|uniref:NAD(P)-dependent oxidoreductase n=1 Tax=Palleronia sp. KMU-117 TaxID=3434108 RepID=UPI003D72D12A